MTKTIEELQAQRIKELEEDRDNLCGRIAELKSTINVQNGILSSRLDAYINLANFWFNQSLIDDKEEMRKFDDISGLRYEYMAEALYNILHTEQSPKRFFKLLKRYNPDL